MSAAVGWSATPSVGDARPERTWLGVLVGSAWIALLGPATHAHAIPADRVRQVAMVGAVALALALVAPRRWWWARLAVAVGSFAALVGPLGHVVAIWLAAGIALAPWVTLARPPLPLIRPPAVSVTVPVLLLTGVSTWLGVSANAVWEPLVPYAAAVALPLVASLRGGSIVRFTYRFGERVGEAVSVLVFTLLGLVVVVLPWALQRAIAFDPLGGPAGWSGRDRVPAQARQPWAPEAIPHRRQRVRWWRVAACLAVIAAVVAAGVAWPSTDTVASARMPAAHAGDAWYRAYAEDVRWVMDERVALQPFAVYRLADVATRTINVVDGYRRTWVAPECGCRRVKVWLYGGDGAFGFDQRDDHTIASELARVAARHGITVDVQNRGLPGQLQWRAALRFANDLSAEEPPDLAIFYQGADEIAGAEMLNDPPIGDIDEPVDPLAQRTYDAIYGIGDERLTPPDGVSVTYLGFPRVDPMSPEEVGRLAASRFDRYRRLGDAAARAAGVPVAYVWQPSRFGRSRGDVGERATVDAAARRALPADVVDLDGVFDGVTGPLFVDDYRHNERGARLVADALFERFRPRLEQVAAGGAR